ncbi:MAG: DUF1223 domain-containing protein, partial [Lacunisphaera sp.]
ESKTFSSGENRVHLLELYSSEGCSSCPPAETWLGELRDAPGLWREFVPVAFHVDYWDRLGWRDKFARKEYTARQSAYAEHWHSENVYTPEFVLDGAEWRAPFGSNLAFPAAKAGSLAAIYAPDGTCRVTFAGIGDGDYEVHVALLGAGITSKVRAGENDGRMLHHDFVVLALKSARMERGSAELKLPIPAEDGIARHALAVWITTKNGLSARQATGGWLD